MPAGVDSRTHDSVLAPLEERARRLSARIDELGTDEVAGRQGLEVELAMLCAVIETNRG